MTWLTLGLAGPPLLAIIALGAHTVLTDLRDGWRQRGKNGTSS